MPDPAKECPACERPYSFIRARVTLQNPHRDRCLRCGIKEEHEQNQKVAESGGVSQGLSEEILSFVQTQEQREAKRAQQKIEAQEGGHTAGNLDTTPKGQGGVGRATQRDAEVRFSEMEGTFGEQSLFNGLDPDTQ